MHKRPVPDWEPDVREAMKGRPNFGVRTSPGNIAACLWDCGEDLLAERALGMSADELAAINRIQAVYEDPTYPLPVVGQGISHRHVAALAAIAYFEGALRPLARVRSRPTKLRPVRFTSAASAPVTLHDAD